jgi:Na+/H+ antiporter NhaD/arsenite permease-like protein
MMFTVSAIAAIITMFFVPPKKNYNDYFDFKTLVCLFSVLIIVRALSSTGLFGWLAGKLTALCGNLRSVALLLTFITLCGSLLITNDMALIAFLPLCYCVLKQANAEKYLAYIFIILTMAANLGGMLTPFGNPQNLYLYSFYNIDTAEFFKIMLPPFAVSVALTVICCLPLPNVKIENIEKTNPPNKRKVAVYLTLFAIVILTIFRILPYPVALIAPIIIAFFDRKTLLEADYPLILTFCAFFVFSGNLSNIPEVETFLGDLTNRYTLLTSVGVSQIISNVPAAVLLSKFTDNFESVLLGVNIGGVGTPVASLASLITIRYFIKYQPGKGLKFAKIFTILNVLFLSILLVIFAVVM